MKKKILIIEDDVNISKILKMMLQQNGYQPLMAFDAITGKSTILSQSPDLIILDISMPGGSGIEIAEFVSINPKICGIPIIVTTASPDVSIRKRADELGVLAFIEKPFDIKQILAVINKEFNANASQ